MTQPLRLRMLKNYDGHGAHFPDYYKGQIIDALPWFASCLMDLGYAVPYDSEMTRR